jgi:hypothetical protein
MLCVSKVALGLRGGEQQPWSLPFTMRISPLTVGVMVIGLLFCVAFVAISFSLRPQPETDRVLVKADRLVRTAGQPQKAN